MNIHLNSKFDDLPFLTVPSAQFPRHDGDMAELHELVDRILCHPARSVARLPHFYLYHRLQDELGIQPAQVSKNLDSLLGRWRRG